MKIAVVVSTFPPYKGGMGNVARDHAEALARAGHAVEVLTPVVDVRCQMSDVRCRRLWAPLRYGNAAFVPQLLWKLREYDAVELHYPFFGGAEWVWLWKKIFGRKKRLVVVYHMDAVGRGWLGLIFRLYRALLLKPILNAAETVITTSRDYLASSQAAAFVNDPRVREVPLAVNTERFRPGGSVKELVGLFVGGLDQAHYFKGVPALLEAFTRTVREVPNVKLRIVGDGDLRGAYQARAQELVIGERVEFLDKVADEELPSIYRTASFLVLPSTDRSEAFGLVTLEAAASGTPAIVSDLPGVRTTVVHGETGLIVPPGDAGALSRAMTELFRHPEKTAAVGRAARERVLRKYARENVDRLIVEANVV